MIESHPGRTVKGPVNGMDMTVDEEILCICVGMSRSHVLGNASGGGASGGADKAGKGSAYFTGGNDRVIRVWALLDFTCVATLEGHTDAVNHMTLDANFLFSGSEDRTIRLWNVADIHDPYVVWLVGTIWVDRWTSLKPPTS